MKLIAILPKDRYQPGTLQVWDGTSILMECVCLGKSDNKMAASKGNPTRNPLEQFGDTPTGVYKVVIGGKKTDTHAYGPLAILALIPISGMALKSYQGSYRRSDLALHSGARNSAGGLRPTYGCLRIFDEDMARLHDFIVSSGPIETLELKED